MNEVSAAVGRTPPSGRSTHDFRSPLIFISAAEPSGDAHGAALIRAVMERSPEARFVGIAGPKMASAGCRTLYDMTRHSAMLLGAVAAIPRGLALLELCEAALRRFPFDAAVVIDSPTLHLPLAARAKAAGIPVLYYIAPQLWAWGECRVHKLRDRTDQVAVILPFEEAYFRDRGVAATFVGHPLAEGFGQRRVDPAARESIRGRSRHFVAVLPGSRRHVVQEVLPGQIEVAQRLAQALPSIGFGVSVANEQVAPIVASLVAGSPVSIQTHAGRLHELIEAADLVLVASGTTTLEVAFHGKPMIVMYNASRVFYHLIGRWLVHTPYLSLPNILAGREIVPEFMPYYRSTAPIAEKAVELLTSDDARGRMIAELAEIVAPLRSSRASERTAELLLGMVEQTRH